MDRKITKKIEEIIKESQLENSKIDLSVLENGIDDFQRKIKENKNRITDAKNCLKGQKLIGRVDYTKDIIDNLTENTRQLHQAIKQIKDFIKSSKKTSIFLQKSEERT